MDMMLEQFKTIFDRPEKVKKLREMILNLAVRGKLVEQDPNDEPASVLLERIRDEKERLVKEKKIKKEKPLADISKEEIPYELPNGWEWISFNDITICRDGERVPVSKEEREQRKKIYDYYGASGVIDKIDSYIFNKPLLLIGEDGANLINRSTPIAFIARGQYWVNNHAHVLDSISEDVLRYISIYINSIDLRPYVTGTAQPKMNQAKMNSIVVAVPPLEEQKRIVEKVDSLMIFCDKLEQSLEKKVHYGSLSAKSVFNSIGNATTTEELEETLRFILSNFKDLSLGDNAVKELKNCILQLAVQGKLVPQDPSDEPAEVLLEKIRDEKERLIKGKKIKKEKPLAEISEEEKKYELPKSWKWSRLSYITSLITDGKHGDCNNKEKSGYYFLSAKDVINDKLVYTNAREITYEDFQEVHNRTNLEPYDILVPNTGASIGKIAIAEENELTYRTTFQKSVAVIKPLREYIDEQYLVCIMRGLLQEMKNKSSGTAMINLLLRELREFIIPIAPLAEQKRIVEKVDSLMQLCDELEKKIEKSKNYSNRLMESILKSSF